MADINISFRTDPETARRSQELFSTLGLDMNTAINIFLHSALDFNGIPFLIQHGYNAETEAAILETEQGINLSEPFDTIDELKEALFT